jgi:DNA-directed RNA polymerase subunit RPC12/RpoP
LVLTLAKKEQKPDDFGMIIQAKCQHCQADFEDEGLEKSVFCPSCGKETFIRATRPDYSAHAATAPEKDSLGNLIAAGYIMAILMPLVGFIIGIILLAKNRVGSGIGCIIVSVICAFIAFAILSSL